MGIFWNKTKVTKEENSSRIAIKTNYILDERPPLPVSEFLLSEAEKEECNLYGFIDSARDDGVFRFLTIGDIRYKSLFEGTEDVQLYGVSGFLVECKKESPLFEWMTTEAWGNSCCVFFTSKSPFDEVLVHFQQFNRVYLEDDEDVYFRYYDPRVFRVYIPTCTKIEIDVFFDKAQNFMMEDQDSGQIETIKKNRFIEDELIIMRSKVTIS